MTSKLNSLCVAAALLNLFGTAQAETEMWSLRGNITNTPCTMAVDTVVIGRVPVAEFNNGGSGIAYAKNFDITLNGCDMATLRTASLRFKGRATPGSANTILALTEGPDTASGIGILILLDDAVHGDVGKSVVFDDFELVNFNVSSNNNTFRFKAYYVRSSEGSSVTPGVANAIATITLSYT